MGAGAIGRRHVELMQRDTGFAVVAIADPAAQSAAYADAQGVAHFADHRRLLERVAPQGVVIATPNALHAEVAIDCLDRGIPVLIEKPVADTLDCARAIVDATRRTGVAALVGHHRRHNPLLRTAREFLRSGGIGRVVAVSATDLRRKPDAYFDAAPWRREPGGGPLLINGIHDLDCLRFLCGEIDSVVAVASRSARGFAVEDTVAVTVTFATGALGTLTLSDAVQAPWAWELASGEEPDYPFQLDDVYRIGGTEGALGVPTLTHWRNERGGGRRDPFVRRQLFYVPADPWLEELRHFAQVIRGTATPLITPDDGARTLAAALAVARSAATGRAVSPGELYG